MLSKIASAIGNGVSTSPSTCLLRCAFNGFSVGTPNRPLPLTRLRATKVGGQEGPTAG